MEEFRLRKDLLNRLLLKLAMIESAVTIGIVFMVYHLIGSIESTQSILIAIVLGKVLFSLRKLWNHRKEWLSYSLQLNDETIARKQGSSEVVLFRNEVSRMMEIPNSGLFIQTAEKQRHLFIPFSVEKYSRVKALLMEWAPIEINPTAASVNMNESMQLRLSRGKTPWRQQVRYVAIAAGTILVLLAVLVIVTSSIMSNVGGNP